MSEFAFDLTERQASRALEQSVRTRASIWMDPPETSNALSFGAHVVGVDSQIITLSVPKDTVAQPEHLIGRYFDAVLTVGTQQYLMTLNVLDAIASQDDTRVVVGRPKLVQVAQRRSHWRLEMPYPVPVEVHWSSQDDNPKMVKGHLRDITIRGAAVLVEPWSESYILIGETVRITLTFPGIDGRMTWPAVVCNKSHSEDLQQLLVGVQFDIDSSNAGMLESREQLRDMICRQLSRSTKK